FIKPVDTTAIPDYLTVIKRPMDFGTMRKKIDNRVYRNIGEFRADFELVIRNATTYNSPTTLYYRTARKLEE
ncbi:Bromodomain-containing protein, partial [Dimargaris cristalligena]